MRGRKRGEATPFLDFLTRGATKEVPGAAEAAASLEGWEGRQGSGHAPELQLQLSSSCASPGAQCPG